MPLNLNKKPDSLKFRSLLREVQLGSEDAIDQLYDYVDDIVSENLKLKSALKSIAKTINNTF